MAAIPKILVQAGFVIHEFDWKEQFQEGKGSEENKSLDQSHKPSISVARKISLASVKQIANIGIENGKVRFYSGNGYVAADKTTFYSTFDQDNDAEKFLADFAKFINKQQIDTTSKMGCLVAFVEDF